VSLALSRRLERVRWNGSEWGGVSVLVRIVWIKDMPTYCLNAVGLFEDPARVPGRSGWLVDRLMK
jgi:hypothetical protein